jgi:hypothetical protein
MDQLNPFSTFYEAETTMRVKPKRDTRILALSILILAALSLGVLIMMGFLKAQSHAQEAVTEKSIASTDGETIVERQLVTFVGDFLMNFYNYSYTVYSLAVKRAEEQMTPELQAFYSAKALDREFIRSLEEKEVSTDRFRITPNSLEFAHSGKTHYVKLSGTMTYTTGINGAQAEWPTSVLIEIVETDQGFKVNNIQRQR